MIDDAQQCIVLQVISGDIDGIIKKKKKKKKKKNNNNRQHSLLLRGVRVLVIFVLRGLLIFTETMSILS